MLSHLWTPTDGAREPLPASFMPITAGCILTGYMLGHGRIRSLIICSTLLWFGLQRPRYTTGSPAEDYASAGLCFIWLVNYVDLEVLSARGPRYLGKLRKTKGMNEGIYRDELVSTLDRVKFGLRLFLATRGVGWEHQVSGIAVHEDAGLSRRAFTVRAGLRFIRGFAMKWLSLYLLGICKTLQSTTVTESWVLEQAITWLGVIWSWQGLAAVYSAVACVAVAVGLCEPWEWPPMYGSLSDVWSIRRVWR